MLKFSDSTQVRVNGLVEIMADLYSNGRQANQEAAEEIINRLEGENYIPSSYLARKEYIYVLLKEYVEYIKGRDNSSPQQAIIPGR